MASFTVRKVKGRYYARIYERGRSPQRTTWPLGTTRKDNAEKAVRTLEDAYVSGNFDPWRGGWLKEDELDGVTTADAIRQFIGAKESAGLAESSIATYENVLTHWRDNFVPVGCALRAVKEAYVYAYVTERSVRRATQRMRYRNLRAFFNWCADQHLIPESPMDDVPMPRGGETAKGSLSPSDIRSILKSIDQWREKRERELAETGGTLADDQWLKVFILIAVSTGLRRGEMLSLTRRDLDPSRGFLYVREKKGFRTKSGSERAVPIRGVARALAEKIIAGEVLPANDPRTPIFRDADGRLISPDRVTRRFKFYVEKSGIPQAEHATLHWLRHTTATWLIEQGVPMPVVSKVLGHSSTQVTAKFYSHISDAATEKAMRAVFGDEGGTVMDLDDLL